MSAKNREITKTVEEYHGWVSVSPEENERINKAVMLYRDCRRQNTATAAV